MRKMYKRRRCSVCKPGKRGFVKRWSTHQELDLRQFERDHGWFERRER
jgi:hypothetical protein